MTIMKALLFLLLVASRYLLFVHGVERRQGDLSNPDNQRIQLIEAERIAAYHERNYTWPLTTYVPNTPGWKALIEERFGQVAEVESSGMRYDGYIQLMNTALLVPNFTQHGFGLARCPDDLLGALQQGIRDGIPTAGLEPTIGAIDTPHGSLFIDRPDLTLRVLQELRHYAETWAQMPLTPYRAYGFRAYQNQSQLYMHVDKIQTHIISFILHIDSSEDAGRYYIYIYIYLKNIPGCVKRES
jgi:hypothetical protein